jgi:hypothetical protein
LIAEGVTVYIGGNRQEKGTRYVSPERFQKLLEGRKKEGEGAWGKARLQKDPLQPPDRTATEIPAIWNGRMNSGADFIREGLVASD